jgi:hypothetical protein
MVHGRLGFIFSYPDHLVTALVEAPVFDDPIGDPGFGADSRETPGGEVGFEVGMVISPQGGFDQPGYCAYRVAREGSIVIQQEHFPAAAHDFANHFGLNGQGEFVQDLAKNAKLKGTLAKFAQGAGIGVQEGDLGVGIAAAGVVDHADGQVHARNPAVPGSAQGDGQFPGPAAGIQDVSAVRDAGEDLVAVRLGDGIDEEVKGAAVVVEGFVGRKHGGMEDWKSGGLEEWGVSKLGDWCIGEWDGYAQERLTGT